MSSHHPSRFGRHSPGPSSIRTLSNSDTVPPNSQNPFVSDYTLRPSSPVSCWALQTHQKGHIRTLECSPSEKWLFSAADDATVLLIDFHGGWTMAKLTLDNANGRFEIITAVWCSETIILCGGSNGFVYVMEFVPQNDSHRISLRVILSPMLEQVRSLRVDASCTRLAIAYGTSVAIYQRAAGAGFDTWDFVDRVAKPSGEPEYLVHGLTWFGQMPRKLLIGYVAARFGIWESPQEVNFLENDLPNACTIGGFSLSGDESFLAITTLEQAVVTYPISHYGPILEEMNLYEYPRTTAKMLALPATISSSNLVLCGTAVSEVDMVYPSGVPAHVMKG
ncbi:hypothetical protein FRC10_000301 [Ceratobasidium sp. 414]|nr:hypothetical protein FRC10_000301 [Ceratobasidium sp. 414]